jgi:hypothetical protein
VVNQLGGGILFYDTTFFGQDLLLDEDHDTASTPPFDRLFDILEKQSIEQIIRNYGKCLLLDKPMCGGSMC